MSKENENIVKLSTKEFTNIFKGSKVVELKNFKQTIVSKETDSTGNLIEKIKAEGCFIVEIENKKPNNNQEINSNQIKEILKDFHDEILKSQNDFRNEVIETITHLDQKVEKRLDKIEADIVELKFDMVEVKKDIVEIKGRLTAIEECPLLKKNLKRLNSFKFLFNILTFSIANIQTKTANY